MTSPSADWVTVVAGLPRSGTSLVMQMLHTAGLPLWTDGRRPADAHNPHGYHEHADLAGLLNDPVAMAAVRGHALKVVFPLARRLPAGPPYRVVFLERDLGEVLASQRVMARMLTGAGPALDDERLARYWSDQLRQGLAELRGRPDVALQTLAFARTVHEPAAAAAELSRFLMLGPEAAATMARAVRPELHRQRGGAGAG